MSGLFRRFATLALATLIAAQCVASSSWLVQTCLGTATNTCQFSPRSSEPPAPANPQLRTVTFPIGSFIVPMDEKQTDVIKSFGFIHALLRNGTPVNRLIEPFPTPPEPSGNITIKTDAKPAGTEYCGGPFIVVQNYSANVIAAQASFPNVTVHAAAEQFSCNYTFVVKKPTEILVIKGIWGHTENLLADMGIPCTVMPPEAVSYNPGIIWDYNLIVDDCPGFAGVMQNNVSENLTEFVNNGNELIFTDIAITDFQDMPWGTKLTPQYSGTDNRVVETIIGGVPDFPGQYFGKPNVLLWQMGGGYSARFPAPDVNVLAYCPGYDEVIACYFYWGQNNGIVEFFGYHPQEQTYTNTNDTDSYKLASILYGNKFLHMAPLDWGVQTTNTAQPKTIAQKGTGSPPSQEQATVRLTVRAVGSQILPENKMQVNYELNPWIDNVTGTFADAHGSPRDPASIIVNPNGSKSLRWEIDSLANGAYWNVSFNVTSLKAADPVYVNAAGRSNVTYVDGDGKARSQPIMVTSLRVTSGSVAEPFLLPAFCAAVLSLCAADTAVCRFRKSR